MIRRLLPALLVAAACGAETEAAPGAEPAAAAVTEQPSAPQPAPDVAGAPPAGDYECYVHGHYGLQNSSMVSLRVHGPAEYEAMEERGRYAVDGEALRMESGPLEGRVARLRESDGRPALVFIRDENEVGGRPTLDISDTWCYFEPR